MDEDDWVNKALADTTLVVEVLLTLRHHRSPPPPLSAAPCLKVKWAVRRLRSSLSRRDATAGKKPARASPTTPLSWSDATTASGGEESSRRTKPVDASRSNSKVGDQSESATAKRSRRKRTLAELREEENLLLKERRHLENELASLYLTVEKHRASNESLKRRKLDLVSCQTSEIATTSLVTGKAVIDLPPEAHCHPSKSVSTQTVKDKVLDDELPDSAANASSEQESSKQEPSFLLPDLNVPLGDDFNSNVYPGIS